ncbi:MAG: alpha/beta hydrolase, partial [Clostridia bacterium]|nr:alpha/beta hydrolase [Clostridia bacterium]
LFSLGGCNKSKETNAYIPLSEQYPNLTFEKSFLEDIPVIHIFKNDGAKKPTMLIIHGYGGSKSDSLDLATKFAYDNYYCVIFDAYGHGERTGMPLKSFPEVLSMYPYDIEKVVLSLENNEQADLDNMGMLGISMGACAIYKYCTFGKVQPKAIAPFIGTPYYEQLYNTELSRIAFDNASGRFKSELSQLDLNTILMESSPYKDIYKLKDIHILMQNGGIDTLVSPMGVYMLEKDLKEMGAKDATLIIYPDLWHEISDDGFDKAFEFMNKHLK